MSTFSENDFIHQYLPTGDPGGRVLLLLHGTGGNESDLLPLAREIDPRAAILSPRGKVLEHGMPRFFRRLAEGVFDVEDLIARTHELADFVDSMAAKYGMDPRRIFAIGYSNGANIAASMLLLRPATLGGAILLRAMVPLKPATPPALQGVPVLIASGRSDSIVPSGEAEELAGLLRAGGADVTIHWEDAGHQISAEDVAAARRWLAER